MRLKDNVTRLLRREGWFITGFSGDDVLMALKDGRTLWVEFGEPCTDLPTPQKRFKDALLARGGEYIVVRTIDDIKGRL